jgi:hypothetical protein
METCSVISTTHSSALIWLDRSHALIARAADGRTKVTEIDRELDAEPAYLLRIAHEADGCDRVVVMGDDVERVAFEREYVALYRRPDQLIDSGAPLRPRPIELADHLRLLEPALGG